MLRALSNMLRQRAVAALRVAQGAPWQPPTPRASALRRSVPSRGNKTEPDRSSWPPLPRDAPPPPPPGVNRTFPTMLVLFAVGATFIYFKPKDNEYVRIAGLPEPPPEHR